MEKSEQLAKVINPERVDFQSLGLKLYEDVVFDVKSGEMLLMDIIVPQEKPKNSLPAVIWVHGGAWISKELDKCYRPEKELVTLASKGFICASINYRLAQTAPFPAQIIDCKTAVRFLRANADQYFVNPDQIGVWGESAGGQLVSLMGVSSDEEFIGDRYLTVSSSVQAVVSWYAPNDMQLIYEQNKLEEAFQFLFPYKEEDKIEAAAREASPINYVKRKVPPFLLMHGDVDQLVPITQSQDFYDALRQNGNEVLFIVVPKQGHGFFDGEEYYQKIYEFFEEKLGTK